MLLDNPKQIDEFALMSLCSTVVLQFKGMRFKHNPYQRMRALVGDLPARIPNTKAGKLEVLRKIQAFHVERVGIPYTSMGKLITELEAEV